MVGVESLAKMSGDDVDVEPYLNSRNTIGHGVATQILKTKCDKIVGVGSGKRWWCLRKAVVVCRSDGGIRKYAWAPGQNLEKVRRKTGWWMELLLSGAGCPGSRFVDEIEDLRVARSNRGKIRRNLWMEIGEKRMES